MRFEASILSWLLFSQPLVLNSTAFSLNKASPSLSSKPFTTTTIFAADSNTGLPKKKKNKPQQQKKKRRFAQDVQPIVAFEPAVPQRTAERVRDTNQKENNKKATAKGRNIQPNLNTSKKMLQNTKSIEDLENIMSKRWGTSSDEWTADFTEWEIADDEGNDTEKTRAVRKSLVSGRKVRSKPVLDPWEKEERKIEYEKEQTRKANKKKEQSSNTNASAFQSAVDRQNSVLNRVKRNQERLQSEGMMKTNDQKIQLDFYDEDDEGYEPLYNGEDDELEADAEDFYNNIISPKPAGGVGASRSIGGGNTESQGGFFFSDMSSEPVVEIELTQEESEKRAKRAEQQKKAKAKKAARKPKLDEDGKRMYLTLEQAQRNCQSIVDGEDDEGSAEALKLSSWQDIGITNPQLLENLANMNCNSPLSVQDKACPSIVSGNDVLISTHTGSGKTLAFLTPLAEQLLFDIENSKPGAKVIVVAPGRELASQIVAVARELFQGTGLTAMLAIGGTPFSRNFEQIRKKKPDFIIGTPGRIAELVVGEAGEKKGKLKIGNLRTIVLDECDALLEYKPHKDPTIATMETLKRRHGDSLQSVLCSATAVDLLGKSILDDLLRPGFSEAKSDKGDKLITSGNQKTTRVSRTAIHGVVRVDHQRYAIDTLRKILYTEPAPQQALIFVDNARRVGIVVEKLAQMGIIAAPLHGGQGSEKGDRAEVNKALRDGYVGLVVATEMAARGLDAPYLTHVINLDLPTDASHYAHRAGRCGRGGRPGVVVNLAVGSREKNVPMKFATALDIEMHLAEPQSGKLAIMEETT